MLARIITVIAACAVTGSTAAAGPVNGTVRTIARPGATPATVVVYAEPVDAPAVRTSRRVTLLQKNKTFQPRVVAVPAGSSVDFPNNDGIFHNVFSLSEPQPFDLGLYRAGDSKQRTFTAPGIYRVFCNIHPQMTAIIVVTPSAYTTIAGADGRFSLDLPAGRYKITALSERAAAASVDATSTAGVSTIPEVTLDETSWSLVQHKNKYGQDYPAAAYQK
jgi:plastocyanin